MEKLKAIHKKAATKVKDAHKKSLELYKNDRKKFIKIAGGLILVLAVVAVIVVRLPHEMTMKEAGKIGEKKTYQLLVKIDNNRGSGGFERGDIVLTASEDKQFSVAEQEGFLIIKMGLTEQQTGLLLQQKGERARQAEMQKDPKDRKEPAVQEPLRRFKVDLKKLGIGDDETRGKVISDKVWDWREVVSEK
jgi:hypothetical protein